MNNPFYQQDILSADQYTKEEIEYILSLTQKMKHVVETVGGNDILRHKMLAALFFEPSSRTFSSFITAMQRLGGGFIPMHGMNYTSVQKGETLEDTIQTFASYADAIVMRHPEAGSVHTAAKVTKKPIINAGDGVGEHPTQCLQDLFTIRQNLGSIDNIRIVMIGDLGHYRPVNSLAKVLVHFHNVELCFVSPPQVKIQDSLRKFLTDHQTNFSEHEALDEVIAEADVLYVTRVKKEYMTEELYNQIQGKYVIDKKTLHQMKKTSIIMHPFPRLGEISVDVDNDTRAVYIREQMKNGMYTRMSLLASILLSEVRI